MTETIVNGSAIVRWASLPCKAAKLVCSIGVRGKTRDQRDGKGGACRCFNLSMSTDLSSHLARGASCA